MSKIGPHDGSEEEIFLKSITHCRSCNHVKLAHAFLIDSARRCIDSSLNVKGEYKTCGCKVFIPKDNLEYLEWKYENSKKLKKRRKK